MNSPAGEQPPAEQPIIDELVRVYGARKLDMYADLAGERPGATPEEIAEEIRHQPTSTTTFFYREKNLTGFAGKVAPVMARALGRGTLRIAQVAASSGEETWSMASLLDAAGVKNYHITATDINTLALTEAEEGKYPSMLVMGGSSPDRTERKAVKKFTRDHAAGTLEPNQKLRDHVGFLQHDILEGPVPGGPYHVIVVNNMLYHYPEETRDRIMKNISGSLVPGGVFLFDNDDGPGHESYIAWSADLEHTHGMQPLALAQDGSAQIRQYKPDRIRRAPRLSAEAVTQIASGPAESAVEKVAVRVTQAIESLPLQSLDAVMESIQTADDVMYHTHGEAYIADSPINIARMLLADITMQLQDIETALHGGSYSLRAYLADLGITGDKSK